MRKYFGAYKILKSCLAVACVASIFFFSVYCSAPLYAAGVAVCGWWFCCAPIFLAKMFLAKFASVGCEGCARMTTML